MAKIFNVDQNLISAANTVLLNGTYPSDPSYRTKLVKNDYHKGEKVLSVIEDCLSDCDEFIFSVAFITEGGLEPLLPVLKELERKRVPGNVLTTDYLTFSDPKALRKLSALSNIKLKMYVTGGSEGFHTKGYIFRKGNIYRSLVGSSNLTLDALTRNNEWNVKVVSKDSGEYSLDILNEFNRLWECDRSIDCPGFIDEYEKRYRLAQKQRRTALSGDVVDYKTLTLKPNKMQLSFISNLEEIVSMGEDRALLVSATGTGKTYASAFAVREMEPEKVLFIVHREQIAKQALESYRHVFGPKKTYGLISGNSKEDKNFDADIVFATMQMMAKEDVRRRFDPRYFDAIIIDEAHRTGAASYKYIMDYFKPKLYLGMTASPERTDGFDVFSLFDHNIAYEIRLQQALEEDMLCPFHYFGITDLVVDGVTVDDQTAVRNFSYLVCEDRVKHIITQADYYGYCGDNLKGLIFVSRREEGRILSDKFNERGFRTVFLGADSTQAERERYVELLSRDASEDEYLDYIFTVDIFNEGIDIPQINQVIMLRPTQSPIVFVQQLGRGLRKAENKEYVVVLDFIGNYTNNFMIPMALFGDRTYNKDNVRRYVTEGSKVLPGASTIHFDEISKKRIFMALDNANFSDIKLIKDNYRNLKYKLGHIPKLADFDKYGEMDVLRIFDNQSLGSYYKFLVKYEDDYKIRVGEKEDRIIEFISKKLASGKRVHELELLRMILSGEDGDLLNKLAESLYSNYSISASDLCLESVANVMTNLFPAGTGRKTYSSCVFLTKKSEGYSVSEEFRKMLEDENFRDILNELVDFGLSRSERDYSLRYEDSNLVLYQKYTYEDACRLLNWDHNEVPLNIGGYKYDSRTKTFPVFINYDKEEDIADTIKYEDHFTSEKTLIAISKQSRNLDSEDVRNFLECEQRGISVELFVRKNKDDKISKEFYYLGRMKPSGYAQEFIMANTTKSAVEIGWILDTPVRDDIYSYIIS